MQLLIALPKKLFRDALVLYLTTSLPKASVVEASSLDQTLRLVGEIPGLDLVVIDAEMPGMDGTSSIQAMCEAAPQVPIALLAHAIRPADVAAALSAGASGVLSKDLSGRVMLKALEILLSGERYAPVSGLLEDEPVAPRPPCGAANGHRSASALDNPLGKLTRRERDVLGLLVDGLSNRRIAEQLRVKDITISFHLKGLFRKLHVMNRTHAATTALRLGWQG